MSTYEEELEGREFDWFAVDSEGNIGIFTTAGEGSMPNAVLENFSVHDAISEKLESPNWGSSGVWSDYSNQGFYVFDWDLPGGPYKRKCSPISEMSSEIKAEIMKVAIALNVAFSQVKEIADV